MGCNNGHYDHVGKNLASAFIDKVGTNGAVVAADGSVGYFPSLFHTIMNSDYFKSELTDGSKRKPLGFLEYTRGYDDSGNAIIVTQIVSDTKGPITTNALIKKIYNFVV